METNDDSRRRKPCWMWVAIIGVRKAPLLAIAFVCILAVCGNDRSFDSTAWQQGDLRIRGSMAEDIIKRKVLVGRPAGDAQRILGRSEKEYASALVYKIDMGMPFKDPAAMHSLYTFTRTAVREVQITD